MPDVKARAASQAPKPILKPDRETGIIVLDSVTQLSGVPAQAWDYRLGNRSALDWVLDQHKEKTPKDRRSVPGSTPIASPTTRSG